MDHSTRPSTVNQPTSSQPSSPAPAAEPHGRRFDTDTYNQISGLDARLLEAINYDCKREAKHRASGARYSTKSEAYFAKILGVCRETISHRICHLERLGILSVTRRRKVRGVWQTNLYKITSWVWWRLGKLLKGLRQSPSRVKQLPHKANPMRENKYQEEEIKGPLRDFTKEILARWEARGLMPKAGAS